MTEKLKILGISGGLRKGSYNTAALHAAAELCPDDASIEIYDIGGFESFDQDLEPNPGAKIAEFKAAIRAADAVIFSSPEYNYSVPGFLKNAIDWASRPYGDSAWDGKPALIMGASGGAIGTARMQYHLRQIMVFLNMFPLNRPEVMINNCVGNSTSRDGSAMKRHASIYDRLLRLWFTGRGGSDPKVADHRGVV